MIQHPLNRILVLHAAILHAPGAVIMRQLGLQLAPFLARRYFISPSRDLGYAFVNTAPILVDRLPASDWLNDARTFRPT